MKTAADAIFTIAHVVTAVLGFGAVGMTGIQSLVARRTPGAGSAARYFRPGPNWISLLLLLTPVFGGLIEVVNGYPDLHRLWPWLALAIWILAGAVGFAVHWPAERRIQRLLPAVAGAGATVSGDSRADDPTGFNGACQAAAVSSLFMLGAFAAALVVMVVQPH